MDKIQARGQKRVDKVQARLGARSAARSRLDYSSASLTGVCAARSHAMYDAGYHDSFMPTLVPRFGF